MKFEEILPKNQKRIGLTGGIASGKSTISEYIHKQKKIEILDADFYSKQLIMPGKESYHKIIEHYGVEITDLESPNKEIITSKLRKIIFNDSLEKIWLENLLHPLIKYQMLNDCIKLIENKTLVLVIPLLFEANFNDLCTEIWLVKCSEDAQRKRLMKRDRISREEAEKLISSQMSLEEKEQKSDIVLVNESSRTNWEKQLDNLL